MDNAAADEFKIGLCYVETTVAWWESSFAFYFDYNAPSDRLSPTDEVKNHKSLHSKLSVDMRLHLRRRDQVK
jgi:hypothetical protein